MNTGSGHGYQSSLTQGPRIGTPGTTFDETSRASTVASIARRMARAAVIRIADPAAWRTILSPVRREIVEAMQELGPCAIAEVAAACGRPADGLYRHVKVLVKAGFLVDAGTRKGRRNTERLFDAAADDFAAPRLRRGSSAAERETVALTAEALAKSAARALRASAAAGRLECGEGARNFSVVHQLSWLTPRRFDELRALALRMNQVLDAGRRERAGDLYETLVVVTPVTRRRGTHSRPAPARARRRAEARR